MGIIVIFLLLKNAIPLYAKSIENLSLADRRNESAIMLTCLENPYSSLQEIYLINKASKNNTFTKDPIYFRKYCLNLLLAGCLKEQSFCKKVYVAPLPKDLKEYHMIHEKCEKIFSLIKENPHVLDNEFFLDFCKSQGLENLSDLKKSRMKMSLIEYKHGIDPTQSFKKQMFSKFFKILLVEGWNFETTIKKFKNKRKISFYEKIDFRLNVLYTILRHFERFLIKYDFSDSYLQEEFGFLAELLDMHYEGSEMCYYAMGHWYGQKQKKSIRMLYKNGYSIGLLHKLYNRSRRHISNIVK